MAAERGRYVIFMGLEVTDDASYACYRANMTPILESHGGFFGCDFIVAKERFFADPRYREVRAEHFEPAVARAIVLAELGGET